MSNLRKAAEDLIPILDRWKMTYPPCTGVDWEKVEALCKALEQEEQEPVAIVNEGMGGIEWLIKPLPDDTPLYTAPPKREWVGLDEDRVAYLADKYAPQIDPAFTKDDDYWRFYQEIEAELKEKNS